MRMAVYQYARQGAVDADAVTGREPPLKGAVKGAVGLSGDNAQYRRLQIGLYASSRISSRTQSGSVSAAGAASHLSVVNNTSAPRASLAKISAVESAIWMAIEVGMLEGGRSVSFPRMGRLGPGRGTRYTAGGYTAGVLLGWTATRAHRAQRKVQLPGEPIGVGVMPGLPGPHRR